MKHHMLPDIRWSSSGKPAHRTPISKHVARLAAIPLAAGLIIQPQPACVAVAAEPASAAPAELANVAAAKLLQGIAAARRRAFDQAIIELSETIRAFMRSRYRAMLVFVTLTVVAAITIPATAQMPSALVVEEMMIPAKDPGIQIYVRNKRPADMDRFSAERTLLYVHGAVYPSETDFDVSLDGVSWMDYIARRGFDVYFLDVRGYGRSTRPPEMDEQPSKNPPLSNGEVAVRDVGSVVDFILARRNVTKLNLLAWSWGTNLMARYATQNPQQVERLALYAPIWMLSSLSAVQTTPIPAYRTITKDELLQRSYTGVPEGKRASLIPPGWFEAVTDARWATDPKGTAMNPPVIRVPRGAGEDARNFQQVGKPFYDAAKITVPTLLVVAEWDESTPPYMAQTLFPLLVNAPSKRLVVLGEGTHSIFMQKNRMDLFRAVQMFLEESPRS